MGMPWLKHYTNAEISDSLNLIKDEFGLKGYGYYWVLLETMGQIWDGESEVVRVRIGRIKEQFRTNRNSIGVNFCTFLNTNCILTCTIYESWIDFDSSILMKLQGRQWRHRRKSGPQVVLKIKRKIKNKRESYIAPPLASLFGADAWLVKVSKASQDSWIEKYPIEYLTKKLSDLIQWKIDNPEKQHKNLSGFFSGCLSRDFKKWKDANQADDDYAKIIKEDPWT